MAMVILLNAEGFERARATISDEDRYDAYRRWRDGEPYTIGSITYRMKAIEWRAATHELIITVEG